MYCLSNQLFTSTGFALNHHRKLRLSSTGDLLTQFLHHFTLADELTSKIVHQRLLRRATLNIRQRFGQNLTILLFARHFTEQFPLLRKYRHKFNEMLIIKSRGHHMTLTNHQ